MNLYALLMNNATMIFYTACMHSFLKEWLNYPQAILEFLEWNYLYVFPLKTSFGGRGESMTVQICEYVEDRCSHFSENKEYQLLLILFLYIMSFFCVYSFFLAIQMNGSDFLFFSFQITIR